MVGRAHFLVRCDFDGRRLPLLGELVQNLVDHVLGLLLLVAEVEL